MLGGEGCYCGRSVLIAGTAGTGKTTVAAHFADAACRRGQRCLFLLFEESPQQMLRNMRATGIDLGPWVDQGSLKCHADRPSRHGLETHLAIIYPAVDQSRPAIVIVDPMTALLAVGTQVDVPTTCSTLAAW
jgi:circadian clock protein KaiC